MNRFDDKGRLIEDDDYDYAYSEDGCRMAYRKHDCTGIQAEPLVGSTVKIFIVALILRLAVYFTASTHLAPDSKLFFGLSESFDFSHSLLYPMILKAVGMAVIPLQLVLDSLTAVMLGTINPLAGWFYAVSLGPITYSNYVLTDTLATFFLTAALWATGRRQ